MQSSVAPNAGQAALPHCKSRRRVLQSAALAFTLQALPALPAPRARAATPDEATETIGRQYDDYAASYDDLDAGPLAQSLGFPDLRAALLARAAGRVLEVGVGTGLNLQFYCPQQLTSLTAVDLSGGMLRQAERRALGLGLPLSFQQADVQQLPFPPSSFDVVVDTFSLCVFPDPAAALRSMASVLRPGGTLLLLEHARSSIAPLGWYQDLTAGAVAAAGKGCVWNQDVLALVRGAGLVPGSVQEHLGGLIVSLEAARP